MIYKNLQKNKLNQFNEPIDFIKEIMQFLLNDSIKFFYNYNKKINYSINNLQNNINKSYIDLLEYIKKNYKSNNFSLDKLIDYHMKILSYKEMDFRNKEKMSSSLYYTDIQTAFKAVRFFAPPKGM